jgi:Uma2 family endonuclease
VCCRPPPLKIVAEEVFVAIVEQTASVAAERRFVIYGVPWDVYDALRQTQENDHVRMTYDEGTLEFMSPSGRHESVKKLLAQLVEAFTTELRIPRRSFGSMTCRQKEKLRGLEPDECYYILHHSRIRELEEIDLEVDPPPDLAIEVEIRRGAMKRMRIYSALGVPEVWRWRKGALKAYSLQADGKYEEIETSLNLPTLRPKELTPFLDAKRAADESQWILSFRQWVQERFGKTI